MTRPAFPAVASAFSAHWQPSPDSSGMLNLKSCEMQHPAADLLLSELLAGLSARDVWQYPRQRDLTCQLAQADGVDASQVMLTAGSYSAIGLIVDALACPAGLLLLQEPAFDGWLYYSALRGVPVTRCEGLVGVPPTVTTRSLTECMLQESAAIVAMTNPGNPTGMVMPIGEVAKIASVAQARGHVLVVDECYGAFCELSHVPLIARYANVVVLRSLSKSCAMAGARMAVVFGNSEVVDYLRRFRPDAAVSAPAVALALAGAARAAELQAIRADVVAIRDEFTARMLADHPQWTALPSGANFITFCTGMPGSGGRIAAALERRRIRIRSLDDVPGLSGCLRFSLAAREQMNSVADLLLEIC